MKTYDLIVIGAGSGLNVSSTAAAQGWKVAVVDDGPFGGTCLNRGCIPSKMLIHAADIVQSIKSAKKFSVKAKYSGINFKELVTRVFKTVDDEAKQLLKANKSSKNITVYRKKATFIGPKTIKVGKEEITADNIVIAAGGRPFIPPIAGIADVPYLTSKTALRLNRLPKSMIVIGGGYISAELSHFFSALGTKITVLERNDMLLHNEDEQVAKEFTLLAQKRYRVILGVNATKVRASKNGVSVRYEEMQSKKRRTVSAEKLLIVVGRKPNSDVLALKEAGYQLTERGYVQTDDYLETSVKGVWALGDIAGKWAFKHSANLEAETVTRNLFLAKKEKVDCTAMPHAVFSSPQIAGVGKTEQELRQEKIPYKKSVYYFKYTGMGMALLDETSFVKVLADEKGQNILGCHIMGHEASTLIHEVVPIMRMGGRVSDIASAVHVHPALSEVVQRAFAGI